MKKMILTFSAGLLILAAHGQQTQGRVVYERTLKIHIDMEGMGEAPMRPMPSTHKDKWEVLFGNNQSLRRAMEDDSPDEMTEVSDGGPRMHMITPGENEITYHNFITGQTVEQLEFAARNYIITDSIPHRNWKLTGETTTILNYPCQQAIAQLIGKRRMTSVENGEMKSQEVADTSRIIAWFTPAIPVPAGPEYQGELPGLILGLEVGDGRVIYQAVEVTAKADLAAVKAPSKGKKLTTREFEAERTKMLEAMQKDAKRRGAVLRIGG